MSTKEESPTKKQKCVQSTVLPPTQELYKELLTELVARLPYHARVLRVNTPLFRPDAKFAFGRELCDILESCPSYTSTNTTPLTEDEIAHLWLVVLQYKKDIDEYKAAQEKATADIMQDLGLDVLEEGEEEEKEGEEVRDNIFGDLEHSVTYIEDCPGGALQGVLERVKIPTLFKTLPEIWVKVFKLFEMVFCTGVRKMHRPWSPVLQREFDMVLFAMMQEIYLEFLHPDLKGGDDDSEPTQTFILLLDQA